MLVKIMTIQNHQIQHQQREEGNRTHKGLLLFTWNLSKFLKAGVTVGTDSVYSESQQQQQGVNRESCRRAEEAVNHREREAPG